MEREKKVIKKKLEHQISSPRARSRVPATADRPPAALIYEHAAPPPCPRIAKLFRPSSNGVRKSDRRFALEARLGCLGCQLHGN